MKKIAALVFCLFLCANAAYATHLVNGVFDSGEWDAATPQKGIYSYFYYDWVDSDLYLANDWVDTEPGLELQDDQWNTFLFSDSQGDDWEFRVYNDNSVEAWENGIEYTGTDITAAYGFGSSPNKSESHTIYEAVIDSSIVGPTYYPMIKEKDPRFVTDTGDGGWEDGPFNTIPEPTTILLFGTGLAGFVGFRKRFRKT